MLNNKWGWWRGEEYNDSYWYQKVVCDIVGTGIWILGELAYGFGYIRGRLTVLWMLFGGR